MINRNYKPPFKSLDLILEVVTLSGLIKMIVLVADTYTRLNERIPIHYSFSGEANGFGSKWMIWLLPAIAGLIYILLTYVSAHPAKLKFPVPLTEENYERQVVNIIRLLRVVKLCVTGILLTLLYETVANAQAEHPLLNPFLLMGGLVIMMVAIGVFVYRSYTLR